MNAVLLWVLEHIMEILIKRSLRETEAVANQLKRDEARGVVDAENIKAYDAASDKSTKIMAAQNLINGARF